MAEDKWARWLKDERWGEHRSALEAALASVRDRILEIARLQPGERVLDMGAGTGLLGLRAAEIVGPQGAVVLLDISADSLREAAHHETVGCERFIVGDALRCPLADGWADAMVMRSVLIYLQDKRAAAQEIARVLRRGGRLAMYEPINRRMPQVVDMSGFEDVAAAYASQIDISPLTSFDEHTLEADFRATGFAAIRVEMDETRWPARGKEWAHAIRHGAPPGYSAYDMLLAAGITPERADEFLAAGEHQLGDRWVTMSCPAMYMLAVN